MDNGTYFMENVRIKMAALFNIWEMLIDLGAIPDYINGYLKILIWHQVIR